MPFPFIPLIGAAASLLGGLLSSRSAPNAPEPPKPPTPEEMLDVIDNVAGVEVLHTRGAGGKPQKIINRLPRTKQAQAMYDEVGRVLMNTFKSLQNLSEEDPNSMINYAPFLSTINKLNQERGEDIAKLTQIPDFNAFTQKFRDMELRTTQEQFNRTRNLRKSELAQLGYGLNSTAWSDSLAAIDAQEAKALRGLDVRAELEGQKYAEKDVRNRVLNYSLGEEGRAAQLQGEAGVLGVQQKYLGDQETHRQRQIAEQAGLFQMASGILGEDQSNPMKSPAPNISMNEDRQQLMAQQMDYQNRLENYRNTPYSFGEAAGYGLSSLGGHMLANPSRFKKGWDDILNPKEKETK